jgi:Terminase large subunit, T4likevirus-type, N-terminal
VSTIEDLIARVGILPPEEQQAVWADAVAQTADLRFVPNPGPQTDAYFSLADVLLYGGQAGGGKSLLELGWGVNEAQNGIIFRRERTQTDGLEKEGKKLITNAASFNGQDLEWNWNDGKSLKLAGMKDPDSWNDHAGRERDYMAFDEGGEFLEKQVSSIIGWLRADPGKRTRVIIGSNPPRTSDGLWLVKWFAPWLDPRFPKPAAPGELRWAVHVTKADEIRVEWVDGPGEYEFEGEPYTAKSYTFIPATLADNPQRNTPEYRAQLQSLPEPLRSQLLYGKFSDSLKDGKDQLIPTRWITLAQERWTDKPPKGVPMCTMGVDASGGGDDPMIIAPRYDGWYAQIIEVPGAEIPIERAGAYCAGVVVSHRQHNAVVAIDMGGGYGGPMYEKLVDNHVACRRYKGAEATTRRSRDGQLKFVNKRSAALWLFREALDPGQPGGSPIQLPPGDSRLVADLTAPTYEITPRGIKAESKEDVCKRLGRSTDRGDAVMMAWFEGPKLIDSALEWMDQTTSNGRIVKRPQVATSGRPPMSAPRKPLSARSRA